MKKRVANNNGTSYVEYNNKKIDKTYFDKLFYKIFLSSLVLLLMVVTNNLYVNKKIKLNVMNEISTNINFIKIISNFNNSIFKFIEEDRLVDVYSKDIYDEVEYKNNVNYIYNNTLNYVNNLVSGYVVRIINDKEGYTIVVKGIDDIEYTFYSLESVNVKMYQYVDDKTILGTALLNRNTKRYEFKLIIKDKGRYLSFYDEAN